MTAAVKFAPSSPTSIGMEMEFQLLDPVTLDLVDGILPLIQLYPDHPYIKPEFIQNTVEVCATICDDLEALETHFLSLVKELHGTCNRLGMALCSAGTHPFSESLALITPIPRYLRIEKTSGHLCRTQITFATHVHIGMVSGDEAIRIMRELKALLPLLIAVSASSPFWRGYDTGYVAYRHRILAATRSYGIPPSFENWRDFSDFYTMTHRAGVFESIHDIHWDIRPRPHLGTLEVRVMDAQPTVGAALALAGFVRCLVHYLRRRKTTNSSWRFPAPGHWWIEKHNHFQASLLGLEARYINDRNGGLTPLRTLLAEVLKETGPVARELGQSAYFSRFEEHCRRGLSYARQRETFQKTGSLKAVTQTLIGDLEAELRRPAPAAVRGR